MHKQRGFINIDYTSFIVTLLVVGISIGVGIGVILCQVVPWIWSLIKPFLHAMTA